MSKDHKPLEAGQVWTYKTRPGEEASRIIICRIEQDPRLGEIVHIQVGGVDLMTKQGPQGVNVIGHAPYSGEALRKDLISLEAAGVALPDFEGGYADWRAAFDEGNAGVWTAPITTMIGGIERAMNQ